MSDKPDCQIQRLVSIVARLRGPDGCPWDREQTTDSLKPFLLEECHEFIGAVEHENSDNIRDELGDLLLQVVLHARIFEEQDLFRLEDAAEAICNKLIRRHPHVFNPEQNDSQTDLDLQWELIKQSEKSSESRNAGLFEHLDNHLPPLLLASKVAKRATRVGLDWPDAKAVLHKVREELDELEEAMLDGDERDMEHELGDLIFSVINLSRHLNIDTEIALRHNISRFVARVAHIESALQCLGKDFSDITPSELDHLWEMAKLSEANGKIT